MQSDPFGLNGGGSSYGYGLGNPLHHTDALGSAVWVCRDPAFDGMLGLIDHYWLKPDTQETGMGSAQAGANAGNQYDFPAQPSNPSVTVLEAADHMPTAASYHPEPISDPYN